MDDLDGKLEPETKRMTENAALYSIAISLKRIADAVCGTGESCGIHEILHHMECRMGPES